MPTIRYRMRGEPPRLGDWIRSSHRPRTSYFIVGIERLGPYKIGGTVGFDPPIVYKLEVEKRPPNAPPGNAVIYPIIWDRRGR